MSEDMDLTVRHGGDNVFADLGLPDPATHLLKAHLVSRLADVLRERKLTQVAAARVAGISQPDVSRILRGHFRDISVERLMRMLIRLGCEVDIVVRPEGNAARSTTISVGAPEIA